MELWNFVYVPMYNQGLSNKHLANMPYSNLWLVQSRNKDKYKMP